MRRRPRANLRRHGAVRREQERQGIASPRAPIARIDEQRWQREESMENAGILGCDALATGLSPPGADKGEEKQSGYVAHAEFFITADASSIMHCNRRYPQHPFGEGIGFMVGAMVVAPRAARARIGLYVARTKRCQCRSRERDRQVWCKGFAGNLQPTSYPFPSEGKVDGTA